jgi:hypothetical protein
MRLDLVCSTGKFEALLLDRYKSNICAPSSHLVEFSMGEYLSFWRLARLIMIRFFL